MRPWPGGRAGRRRPVGAPAARGGRGGRPAGVGLTCLFVLCTGPAGHAAPPRALAALPLCEYEVVRVYPHRREAFTQGLALAGGVLYEGTGLYGRSTLAALDLESGRPVREVALPGSLFGEGVTVLGRRVYQLTWREGRALVYDRASLAPAGAFAYSGEGWGLTHDGTGLIRSDGSATLRFIEPNGFQERRRVVVRAGGWAVPGLNELEWVGGEVLANVWPTDTVLRVDPTDGRALGRLDLAPLRAREGVLEDEAVPNGIAYDPDSGRLVVTGKLWGAIYGIRPTGEACGPLVGVGAGEAGTAP